MTPIQKKYFHSIVLSQQPLFKNGTIHKKVIRIIPNYILYLHSSACSKLFQNSGIGGGLGCAELLSKQRKISQFQHG